MPKTSLVRFLPVLVIVAILTLAPVFIRNPYIVGVLIRIGIGVIVCLGLQTLMTTSLVSVAQAAFVGVGAYTSVLFFVRLGWNYWLCLLLAGITAAVFAAIIGIAVLRAKGIYFFIVTLAFGFVFNVVVARWISLTGGTRGFTKIPPPNPIPLGFTTIEFGYANAAQLYYVILVVCLFSIYVLYRFNRSRIGTTLRSIGEADVIAEHVGINLFAYKELAFIVCCFMAGIAGSLQAEYLLFISSGSFPVSDSIYAIIYAVVGGYGSLVGAIIGPFVVIWIGEGLTFLPAVKPEYFPFFYGVILLLVISFLPGGLVSAQAAIGHQVRKAIGLWRGNRKHLC